MLKKIIIVYLFFVQLNWVHAQFDFGTTQSQGTTNKPIVPATPTTAPGNYNQDEINKVIGIVKEVEDKQNFINLGNLSPDSNVALPVGIIKDIGAVRYVIAIDSMKFKAEGAFFSAYAAISFPGTLKKLAFRGSNIKFNPAGVVGGNQARLYLASSHTIQINPTVKLRLLDNGQNWVEWDCNGFKAINLVGNFEFSKSKIVPDSATAADTIVRASFQIYTQNIHEFITTVNISPFKLVGLPGWSFSVTDAVVDMSELANAPSMTFPPGYNNPNLNPEPNVPEGEFLQTGGMTDLSNQSYSQSSNNSSGNSNSPSNQMQPEMWRGFFMRALKVKLPPEISKTGQRTEINVSNLLIDNTGVSGAFEVKPVLNLGDANMSGWGFSIDQLRADFVCNNLTGGQLKGRIAIPVDEINSLSFNASMFKNSEKNRIDYNFVVNPTNNINFDVFGATVNLNNNSYMSITRTENNRFKPTLVLNGYIGFKIPKFNSNDGRLGFQNLTLVTDAPYVTDGLFSLSLTNGARLSMKHFSLTLNDLELGVNQGKPVLSASVGVNVTGSESFDISLGTRIFVRGKVVPSSNPAFSKIGRLVLDDFGINGFAIGVDVAPFKLQGSVSFMENHPTYGDGIFGTVNFALPGVFEFPVGASLGFGNTGVFKYYYVDVKIPGPIPLPPSPFILTSVVGGLYYHLQPNKVSTTDFINLTSSFSSITNAPLNYVPSASVPLGVKVGASIITTSGEFKATALLDLAFNNGGGLSNVNLSGNASAVAGNLPINGNMMMNYNVPTKTFDGLFGISATYYGIVNGNGLLKIHSEPSYWNICAGTPSQPMSIRFLNLANANGYIMTGHNLELPSTASKIPAGRQAGSLVNGQGSCLGSSLKSDIDKNFKIGSFNLSAKLKCDLGFDAMIRNYGPNATCSGTSNKVGFNGRQIEGYAYAYINTNISIHGDFKFPSNCPSSYQTHLVCCHGCKNPRYNCITFNTPCAINESFNEIIFSSGVEMNLSLKLPKPIYFSGSIIKPYNYFGGKVKGDVDVNFSYGDDCTVVPN